MKVLVVAEHDNAALKSVTLSAVAAALKFAPECDVLVAGSGCQAAAAAAAAVAGVHEVLAADAPQLANHLPEALAETLVKVQREGAYTHVLFVAGSVAKAAMPRAAALLDVQCISEIAEVIDASTVRRFIYAGSILSTVKNNQQMLLASVRPTSFEPVEGSQAPCPVRAVEAAPAPRAFEFVSMAGEKSDRPDLVTAKIVVSGGRGLIDEAGWQQMVQFADRIGAAVGSTRALVDAAISPSETQVGQTGKIVAPDLYFAFGISGAIQHVAGMKDSKVIVAVNKDPEAAIFEVCDYYIEADAVETIRELAAKL